MRPLAGIRVLDISRVVSGPFAGRILSDLGAEVVKVEPPAGDETRAYGLERAGLTGSFIQQNVGKQNISIDLKAPGGRELLLRLAGVADIVVENFRPGVLDRLSLGWQVLHAANPALVLLSITGFGQSGPAVARRAYAPVIHAETGLIARQAACDGRPPTDPMPSIADTNASLHGVVAVLAALHLRSRTGKGQHIDIAMTDAMLSTDDYSHHALDGQPIIKVGGDVWDAPGGQLLTAGLFEKTWAGISTRYDLAELDSAEPPPVADQMRVVQRWMKTFPTRQALLDALDSAGVPWANVCRPMDVFQSDWAKYRGTSAEIDDRAGGTRSVVQTPYKFSDAESGVAGRIAYRGEDNAGVLRDWLGMSSSAIAELESSGALTAEQPPGPEHIGGRDGLSERQDTSVREP